MSTVLETSIPGSLLILLGILLTLSLVSCAGSDTSESTEDLFARGEFLCLEQEWGESRNVLREFLLKNPDHPGAHFYLGRSYLMWEDSFRPVIAEGELQIALQLFHENNEISYIERFPPSYFEMICNIDSAKVCLKEFGTVLNLGAPKSQLLHLAARARKYVEAAREVIPDAPEVAEYEEHVSRMEAFASRR
ncbi:MAG: hypothetical protein VCC01_10305 [Candidatus Hydrogenedentota bacterium]